MSLAIVCPNKNAQEWVNALSREGAGMDIQVWPDVDRPSDVQVALCWKPPRGALVDYPNLKAIISMGAGVDDLLADDSIPAHVPIVRLVDPTLAQSMFEYLCRIILFDSPWLNALGKAQKRGAWVPSEAPSFRDTTIGMLGLGQIGGYCARRFADMGFRVKGWSRSLKSLPGIETFGGNDLRSFLAEVDCLVCVLPLTPETVEILDSDLFSRLASNAHLINVGRGHHLNESDLLQALDEGMLGHATLDVFRDEPLPKNHSFWAHPAIRITPHCSSLTNVTAVVPQVIENYQRVREREPLLNRVDRDLGY